MLMAGALGSAQSTPSSTPDAFLAQVTRATRDSFATDISANGRFVVFEANADAATLKPGETTSTKTPTNTDGNTEIFLYDYAQRRVFQLTNTRAVLNPSPSPTASPSPSPSPSPSVSPTASPTPTPSPTATPVPFTSIKIDIQNKRPMISAEPALSGGLRTYTIVFSSNAPNPQSFDGTDPGPIAADGGRTLSQDANEELWTYRFTVPEVADLSQGADIPFQDLSTGTFTRITSTPASRAPMAGSNTTFPFVADDNRDATISDDGEILAFSSTRDLVAGGNVDTGAPAPDPEIFVFNRGTGFFTQITNTKTSTNPFLPGTFNDYPSIGGSSGAYAIAFYSNADLTPTASPNNSDLNAEIFTVSFNGVAASGLKQATRTKDPVDPTLGTILRPANNFSFGAMRISRDGRYVGLESRATDPKANASTPDTSFLVTFVYDGVSDAFAQVGPRATATPGDVTHFPTFTDYVGTTPGTVIFTSGLNIKSDGTILTQGDAAGLNPATVSQIFAVPLTFPSMSSGPFTRITDIQGTNTLAPVNSLPSNSRRRIAFTMGGAELGGINPDFGAEVFYNLSPPNTATSAGTISLFTGASLIPVAPASPTPTGSPTPSPSPSPAGTPSGPLVASGLAAGELSVINATVSLAPSSAMTGNASESQFGPPLPVELKGVSVSIRGAACGMYSVSPTAISFVVPPGLTQGTYPLVINNNGTVIRGNIMIVAAQPDIFTTTNGPGGRASICNITDPTISGCVPEPFNVTSPPSPGGSPVPTILELHATGVRGTPAASISVVIGTTAITPSSNLANDQPGFDNIVITLPSTVDRGDLPVVVKVGAATSRPTPGDSPPRVVINP
jgi:uncharacterized protein (TIGR03437 family)